MSALDDLFERPDWHALAACRGADPSLFFPKPGDTRTVRAAQRICDGCPVKEQCRDFGLGEQAGIWGGLTGKQRVQVRRMRGDGRPGPRPGRTAPKDHRCECEACGSSFWAAKPGSRFCSNACRTFDWKQRHGQRTERHGHPGRRLTVVSG